MNILGISAHYHDSAAALVVDSVPVCAVQEERLSRHKGDPAFPLLAIESCLQHAGIEPNELDAVVFYERPMPSVVGRDLSAPTDGKEKATLAPKGPNPSKLCQPALKTPVVCSGSEQL